MTMTVEQRYEWLNGRIQHDVRIREHMPDAVSAVLIFHSPYDEVSTADSDGWPRKRARGLPDWRCRICIAPHEEQEDYPCRTVETIIEALGLVW